jgi:hypothetical protein
MELEISVNFGCDQIEIPLSDGSSIEITCKIKKAIVVAKPLNSIFVENNFSPLDTGYSYDQKFHRQSVRSRTDSNELAATANLNASNTGKNVNLDTALGSYRNQENANCDQYEVSGTRSFSQVVFSSDQISINENPDTSPLEGYYVNQEKCFRIQPDNEEQPYGVIARLLVKKSWMELTDPAPAKLSDYFLDLWNRAFHGKTSMDIFHRKAFEALLDHLVKTGLQYQDDTKYAVFAARGVKASPSEELSSQASYSKLYKRPLRISAEDFETTLSGSQNEVIHLLNAAGADTYGLSEKPTYFTFEDDDRVSISSSRKFKLHDIKHELSKWAPTKIYFRHTKLPQNANFLTPSHLIEHIRRHITVKIPANLHKDLRQEVTISDSFLKLEFYIDALDTPPDEFADEIFSRYFYGSWIKNSNIEKKEIYRQI